MFLDTLTANNVFLVDPWWNPEVEKQAIGRVHRFGQGNNVTVNVLRFICMNTYEEEVEELKRNKERMSQIILDTHHFINELLMVGSIM